MCSGCGSRRWPWTRRKQERGCLGVWAVSVALSVLFCSSGRGPGGYRDRRCGSPRCADVLLLGGNCNTGLLCWKVPVSLRFPIGSVAWGDIVADRGLRRRGCGLVWVLFFPARLARAFSGDWGFGLGGWRARL